MFWVDMQTSSTVACSKSFMINLYEANYVLLILRRAVTVRRFFLVPTIRFLISNKDNNTEMCHLL